MSFFKSRGKHARGAGESNSENEETVAVVDSAANEPAVPQQDAQSEEAAAQPDAAAPASDGLSPSGADGEVAGDFASEGAVVAFEMPHRKKGKAAKAAGITLGVIAGVLAVAYIAGSLAFSYWFLPGTTIGDIDVSLRTPDEAVELIDDAVDNYRLDVVGNGFSYRTTASELGLSADPQAIVAAVHADLNSWEWPLLLAQGAHDEAGDLAVAYRRSAYDSEVRSAVGRFNETATPPEDATIEFDEKAGSFKVKAEVLGTQLDPDAVLAAMEDAIDSLAPKVVLGQDQCYQPTVFSTDEKLAESAKLASGMVCANIALTLDGHDVGTVDAEALASFVAIDEDLNVHLDEEAMNAWVSGLAKGFNTVGSQRTYTRPDGKVITVSDGSYGWSIDAEALKAQIIDGIKEGATTVIDIPCESTAFAFTGVGQPDWGNRYLDVDLSEQHVRFYGDDGSIIWESACITGSPDGEHNTWEGVWYVNNKESPSKLVGYEHGKKIYETTVTYWMPFEGNGIGFHDATWQPSFGGSMYRSGYGSHGCVNLSYSAAQSLYDIVQVGDVVIVHW